MAGRILLIGESSDDLTELKIDFEEMGLAVMMAPDGLAGIEAGGEFQPDLVVTEILTNRLSGFELASRIASGVTGFAAPVIFYTEFYRDEKARREVLAKYGATQYFVRPFQKEALKKSVIAHFQDFLGSLPRVAVGESNPESKSRATDVQPAAPQLSRAAAAAEKAPAGPTSGRSVQPASQESPVGEVPARVRAFSTEAQPPAQEATQPEPESAATSVGRPGSQPAELAAAMEVYPTSKEARAPEEDSAPRERGLLLPVAERSWVSRFLQSSVFRIAALMIIVALALFAVRNQVREMKENTPTAQAEPPPASQKPLESPSELASPVAAPSSKTDSASEPAASGEPGSRDERSALSTAAPVPIASPRPADASTTTAEPGRRLTAQPDRSPGLSIRDVTGARKGPVLRRMKLPQLSPEMLQSLAVKAVVVRVVIDDAGKVTEVTPLNQDGGAVTLPPDALAAIQQWEFSRSRSKADGEAVKYYSLKVQNPRQ